MEKKNILIVVLGTTEENGQLESRDVEVKGCMGDVWKGQSPWEMEGVVCWNVI